ncbi:hypothetical protein Ruko_25060 [Ruthenibacterium sp. TH_2024_36131]
MREGKRNAPQKVGGAALGPAPPGGQRIGPGAQLAKQRAAYTAPFRKFMNGYTSQLFEMGENSRYTGRDAK